MKKFSFFLAGVAVLMATPAYASQYSNDSCKTNTCAASSVTVGSHEAKSAVYKQLDRLGIRVAMHDIRVDQSFWNHKRANGTRVLVNGVQGGQGEYYLTVDCINRLNRGQNCIEPMAGAPKQLPGTACEGQNSQAVIATMYTAPATSGQSYTSQPVVIHNHISAPQPAAPAPAQPDYLMALLNSPEPEFDGYSISRDQKAWNDMQVERENGTKGMIGDLGKAAIGGYFYKEGQKARRPDVQTINAGDVRVDSNVDTDVDIDTDTDVTVPVRPENDGGTSDTGGGHDDGDTREENDGGTSGDANDNSDSDDSGDTGRTETDGGSSGR